VSARRLQAAYLEACRLDLAALKPGNVGWHAPGHGMAPRDFLLSARASAAALTRRGAGLGGRIEAAVEATRAAVGCNTNLGILLLCAPLLQAGPAEGPEPLRRRLQAALARCGVAECEAVYRAIRQAAPGGLGRSPRHDVHGPARAGLVTAMAAAAARDRIARQYATGFADLFGYALPRLRRHLARWGDRAWAASALYLDLLGRYPDSHVARRHGAAAAERLRRRMAPHARALAASTRPAARRARLLALDRTLKKSGINPGTTADLTVATLLAERLTSGRRQPIPTPGREPGEVPAPAVPRPLNERGARQWQ